MRRSPSKNLSATGELSSLIKKTINGKAMYEWSKICRSSFITWQRQLYRTLWRRTYRRLARAFCALLRQAERNAPQTAKSRKKSYLKKKNYQNWTYREILASAIFSPLNQSGFAFIGLPYKHPYKLCKKYTTATAERTEFAVMCRTKVVERVNAEVWRQAHSMLIKTLEGDPLTIE